MANTACALAQRSPTRTGTLLTERLGVSVATFKRILDSARRLGLRIVWRRRDGSIGRGPHGWYDVQAWGVFDAREVRAWYRRRKK